MRAPRTDQQRMASAYQGTIEAVLAMVLCAGGGYWIDQRFGTEPFGLFGGMVLGFACFMVRMWRMRGLMTAGPPTAGPTDEAETKDTPDSR